jgi:hypothetical protein
MDVDFVPTAYFKAFELRNYWAGERFRTGLNFHAVAVKKNCLIKTRLEFNLLCIIPLCREFNILLLRFFHG